MSAAAPADRPQHPGPTPMQIALFGTSADPPTLGHQRILTWLTPQFDHIAVWASDNPFKDHRASLTDRHAMLQCLIEDCDRPEFGPEFGPESGPEFGSEYGSKLHLHPELSYPRSLDTLSAAQVTWPEAQFTFVIGSDLLGQLPRWYQADRFLSQVQLLVIPRPGTPIEAADRQRVEALGSAITIAPIAGLPVSSTAYRSGDRQTVSPRVARYIQTHQLYERPCPDSPSALAPSQPSRSRPLAQPSTCP
jgi:nicotinate-nucleotide adenylyltransferase